jgi:hypothetical protein
LSSRVWKGGITTTYGYNNAGDLATISYSDTTPGTTNGVDRRGRRIRKQFFTYSGGWQEQTDTLFL